MADEVPVCDVLCEAMEYLSKLGSNLRTRSEALKEKRVRKDKLKNAHAVQKAANKVLLICQLSKKSLDNVESGVKKILTLVDASQASTCDGGKSSNADKPSTSKKIDFQYFEYRSRKLKVAKKVSIKHYMSAKVMARSIPNSMQDKYPVYYDCKLYRYRKRKALKEKIQRERSGRHSPRRDVHAKDESAQKKQNEKSSRELVTPEFESDREEKKDKDRRGSKTSDGESLMRKDDDESYSSKEEKRLLLESDSDDSHNKDSKIVKNRKESDKFLEKSVKPIFVSNESEGRKTSGEGSDIEKTTHKKHREADKSLTTNRNSKKLNKRTCSSESEILEKESQSKTYKDKEDSSKALNSPGSKDDSNNKEDQKISGSVSDDSCKTTKNHEKAKNKKSEKKRNDSNSNSIESDHPKKSDEDSDSNDIADRKRTHDYKSIDSGDEENESNEKRNKDKYDSNVTSDTESNKKSKSYSEESNKESGDDRRVSIDAPSEFCDTSKSSSRKERKYSESNKTSHKVDSNNTIELNKKIELGSPKLLEKSESNKDSKIKNKETAENSKDVIESERAKDESNKKRNDSKYNSNDSDSSEKSSGGKKHRRYSESIKKTKKYRSHKNEEKRRRSIYLSSDTDEEVQTQKQKMEKQARKMFKNIKALEDSDSSKEDINKPDVNVNEEVINLEKDNDEDKEHKPEKPGQHPEPVKPLIKLVNINKLLKPDILQNEQFTKQAINLKQDKENEFTTQSKDSPRSSAMKSSNKHDRSNMKFKKVRYEDEEKFWAPKRKEVEDFIPKKFTINIIRVAKLSKLLHEHNLRKITQRGSIICKLNDDTISPGNSQSRSRNLEDTNVKEAEQLSDINTVKISLLVDSDFDKSESSPVNNSTCETENFKITVLDESDSEMIYDQESNKDVQTATKKKIKKSRSNGNDEEDHRSVKKTFVDDSDSTKNDEQHKDSQADTQKSSSKCSLKDYEAVKNNLLEESDSEKNVNKNNNKDDKSKEGSEDDKAYSERSDEENVKSQRTSKKKSKYKRRTMDEETNSVKNNLLQDSDSDFEMKDDEKNETVKIVQLDGLDSKRNDKQGGDKNLKMVTKKTISKSQESDDVDTDKSKPLDSDAEKNDEQDSDKHLQMATKKKQSRSKGDEDDETDIFHNKLLDDSDSEKNDGQDSDKDLQTATKKKQSRSKGSNENDETDIVQNNPHNSDSEKEEKEQDLQKATKKKQSKSKSTHENDETDIVKNKLLDDSDSEKNDDQDNILLTERNESNSEIHDEEFDVSFIDYLEENTSMAHSKKTQSSEQENNKTPDKEISPANEDPDKIKSSLLTNSSNETLKSGNKKRKCSGGTPQSKRKHIKESMHAKKMLLTYSSSSENEDEQLKEVFQENSLLKSISSDEEKGSKESHCRKLYTSSDSDEDILKRAKKNKKNRSKISSEEEVEVTKKSSDGNENEEATKDQSNINQIDGTMDETSNSSKMGRSREKAGGSSHNSDNQEDKDVDSLTNLDTLNMPRSRRRRGSTDKPSTSSRKKSSKAPPPLITGEGLLEAPTSSSDDANSDAAEEDLPPVTLSGLNGGVIDHLAKDDLLVDSDSSSSNDKGKDESSNEKDDDEDTKQESESDTDKNVKTKRRKAHAISSDSEAGSSRPKGSHRNRVSDFEDSEADSSDQVKKNKRKKKAATDSDASGGSSNEGSKKKRRRIKQIDDSDASGSDSENEGRKHGRKNIRKVMGKNQLEEATKKAAREERERCARIAERQKIYNNLEFDESGKPDEVVLDKVVLDFDPETKKPLIELDRGLVKKLKPHQANGIKFMWDACFESVKRIKKDRGSGCILAHCMGLGKTLQVVALTHTLLTHSDLTSVNRVLVVCPLSTVLNWVNEFRMWLKFSETDFEVDVYELSRYKQNSERAFQLSQWFEHGGVCVLGYEMYRNLSADNNKKFKKKMLKNFQESLVDPGPDMVVCDEGHLLKNEKTSLSQAMNRVRTHRRIVLTGTPLQNNLKEYYCMVTFVKPNLLGKYNEYLNRFVNPITNGQYTDSTEHDIRIMKRRSHVLHKMLDGAVQRRDYGVLAPFLPPKHEYVLFITLTDVQIKLYQHYLDNYSRRPLPGKSSGFLFPDFQSLQRIWTHPLVLKYNSDRYEIMQQKKRDKEEEDSEGSLADFIDDESTPDESSEEESSDDSSDMSDDSRKKSKKKKNKKSKKESKAASRRATRANPVEHAEEEEVKELPDLMEVKADNPTDWWIPMVTEDEVEDIRNSHKLVLLFEILRQCEAIGDKLLVFSQSLYSLDLIEHFLGKVDEATQEGRIDDKLGRHVGSWSPGVDYFRLDGSTSCENRSIWCKNFNREDNPRARLFLISTRAGGLGINLVAANRVVIFDVSWNPSHDVQSIFRVYRFGQKKPCYVYRFLVMGTMEEKIYERQVTKQAISKRVIDEQQIDRHYAENDLAELYKFEPKHPEPRPVPLVPKDRLFAEMLKDHEAAVYKFHEHDSLLENKEEETLSEEERKAAWDDFENEKNKPPPMPFANTWPMHNGMVPNLLAQQQQQLAYTALASMLRKDMPSLSDDQIRGMLPLIYGANPGMFGGYDYGLMQKLGDIYKYPQPSMINPMAMMNSVMNPGVGAMGGGGTSGLQYEPPWARDQRDQQNMRLQQLLQQQNQMGAKFYAGGLGSRDPVAMALQQQRAREIMLGEQARQRGRPPLQPRAPPAAPAPADVVNLADSD